MVVTFHCFLTEWIRNIRKWHSSNGIINHYSIRISHIYTCIVGFRHRLTSFTTCQQTSWPTFRRQSGFRKSVMMTNVSIKKFISAHHKTTNTFQIWRWCLMCPQKVVKTWYKTIFSSHTSPPFCLSFLTFVTFELSSKDSFYRWHQLKLPNKCRLTPVHLVTTV